MTNEIESLVTELANAARKSFVELFSNGERFYYCVLITTGEALPPVISAWSWEALEREANKRENPEEYNQLLKWSYSDSPYFNFGEDNFTEVRNLFARRPTIETLNDDRWQEEFATRLSIMESAMKLIDKEGVFSLNQPRQNVYINVEIVPPDETNTARALYLNDPKDIQDWLNEAAE